MTYAAIALAADGVWFCVCRGHDEASAEGVRRAAIGEIDLLEPWGASASETEHQRLLSTLVVLPETEAWGQYRDAMASAFPREAQDH